jgi:hypothetical protein
MAGLSGLSSDAAYVRLIDMLHPANSLNPRVMSIPRMSVPDAVDGSSTGT